MATEQDYALLRADLGLSAAELSDEEAAAVFTQAAAAYPDGSETVQALAARVIVARRQWTAASELVDYSQNEESERLGQMAEAKRLLYLEWKEQLDAAIAAEASTKHPPTVPPSGSVRLRPIW